MKELQKVSSPTCHIHRTENEINSFFYNHSSQYQNVCFHYSCTLNSQTGGCVCKSALLFFFFFKQEKKL